MSLSQVRGGLDADALRDAAVGALPWLAGRLDDLRDVADLTLLPVRINPYRRANCSA